ncbi:MAG: phytanoyl-CoA dioxygenase [Arcobacter sp.]|uniref:phytanoyl-CoA dioxygenase family protein n=1 Tax=uncultured Arcobacter sp. TaxID=165434 RepID=UPI000CBECF42|nr:phytanoyl-CoA dioxygenase family protein [uncultured Arcobacter sp.]PLY10394.1 MAG: phytanoyl-CoA dioxygenase [Arcobacter sp.]
MNDLYPSRKETERIIERIDPTVYSDKAVGEYSIDNISRKEYEDNGYVVFPNLFSQDEINEIDYMASNEDLVKNEEFIKEPGNNELRTIFNQHLFSSLFEKISKDARIIDKVKQLLGSDVYIHHSRVNIKPAYKGKSFPWHSDFETWHCEDGLPRCRCLTAWIMLTDNTQFNGPLYLIPGSHKKFVSCKGFTPEDNYKKSLKKQEYGVPSIHAIKELTKNSELVGAYGKAGTLVIHDGNVLHGSPDNISPDSRTNTFFVFNSVENKPVKPFGAPKNRADFLCLKDFKAIEAK